MSFVRCKVRTHFSEVIGEHLSRAASALVITGGLVLSIWASSRDKCDLVESYWLGKNACVVKSVDFMQFLESVKQLGTCRWAIVTEPPPEESRVA